ncbi:hypothetical protein [Planktothrix agardhii]|uniref:hypothetical protein n=1 Tax=Planktothrix agardhii TaxID=1160 RepID=UPI001F3EEA63|nr:hypothetical protein [Planktothrix agardhii]MCF3576749.1 hypothetical protein [Planktothrix agardhii 1812]
MQNSEEELLKPSPHPVDGWKLAEYVSIAGTAVGTLVAAWYQPIIFAGTPLTLALILNVVNRQRFEQDMRQDLDAAITDVELDPITDVLTELQRVTQGLEKNALRQDDWEVMNVRFQLIQETIDELKTSMETSGLNFEKNDQESLNATLEAFVNQSITDSATMQIQIDQLSEQVNILQTEQQTLIKPYIKRLVNAVKELKNR